MYIKRSDTVSPDDSPPSPQYTPPPPSPRINIQEPTKMKDIPFKTKKESRYQKYSYLFISNFRKIPCLVLSFTIGFTISLLV